MEKTINERDNKSFFEFKIIVEKKFTDCEKRNMKADVLKVIKTNNLSLNQAFDLLDSVKETLKEKPLWI